MGEMADMDVADAEMRECPFCHDEGCEVCDQDEPMTAPAPTPLARVREDLLTISRCRVFTTAEALRRDVAARASRSLTALTAHSEAVAALRGQVAEAVAILANGTDYEKLHAVAILEDGLAALEDGA